MDTKPRLTSDKGEVHKSPNVVQNILSEAIETSERLDKAKCYRKSSDESSLSQSQNNLIKSKNNLSNSVNNLRGPFTRSRSNLTETSSGKMSLSRSNLSNLNGSNGNLSGSRSKIPLPLHSLSRENSKDTMDVSSLRSLPVTQKKPPTPPKPVHLKATAERSVLKREFSLPATRPPVKPRREASFDSQSSLCSSLRSAATSSKIPVWKGSQEGLERPKKWESCTELSRSFHLGSNDAPNQRPIPQPRPTSLSSKLPVRPTNSLNVMASTSANNGSVRTKSSITFGGHNKLKASKSVDLFKAQLEEKDKTIEALKQAAKERDWKLEKLQLNLQTFRSVGSLKDLSLCNPSLEIENSASETVDMSTYMTLLQENAELHRANQLLVALSDSGNAKKDPLVTELKVAESRIKDLEALLEGREVDLTLVEEKRHLQELNIGLSEKLSAMHTREAKALAQAKDARDQAELLEFRVLELEEEQEKLQNVIIQDRSRDRSIPPDSGCNTSTATEEDIAERCQDFKSEKVAITRNRLQELVACTSEAENKSVLLQTVALFETLVAKINELKAENAKLKGAEEDFSKFEDLVLELESTRGKLQLAEQAASEKVSECEALSEKVNDLEKEISERDKTQMQIRDRQSQVESNLRKQVSELQNKLSSSMTGRQSESEMIQDAMLKITTLEKTVIELKQKVKKYSEENVDLKEQLSNALEHHTSKSIGSVGSEFGGSSSGHRKAPSVLSEGSDHHKTTGTSSGVSSDLSDNESNDEAEHDHHSHKRVSESSNNSASGNMEESGIFEEPNHEPNHSKKKTINIEIGTQTIQNDKFVSKEVSKLNAHGNSPVILRQASDYESCEELDDLKVECRDLVFRKNNLENEIEGYKGEIKSLRRKVEGYASDNKITELERLEFSLRNQLKEWEKKYEILRKQNETLLEEKCELEEAENDSRLRAQRLDQDYNLALEKNKLLSEELELERRNRAIMQDEIHDLRSNELEHVNDSEYFEALIQRYEQRIFELEELEVELREKLTLLEHACVIVAWVNAIVKQGSLNLRALPMVMELNEKESQTDWDPSLNDLNKEWTTLIQKERDNLKEKVEKLEAEQTELRKNLQDDAEKEAAIARMQKEIHELKELARSVQDEHLRELESLRQSLESRQTQVQDKIQRLAETKEPSSNTELEQLKQELHELKEKEAAYNHTIHEADSILERVQENYKETIRTLEEQKTVLEDKVNQFEKREASLRKDIQDVSRQGSESHLKIAELMKQLLDAEKREIALKDQVFQLEKVGRDTDLKLIEASAVNDRDALLKMIQNLEADKSQLLARLEKLPELEKKISEMHQNEQALRDRIEELEEIEHSLRSDLQNITREFQEKEVRLRDAARRAEEDLEAHREALNSAQKDLRKQNTLRIEVEGQLNEQMSEMHQRAKDRDLVEKSLRNEVENLRDHLNQAQTQLRETVTLNETLQCDVKRLSNDLHCKTSESALTREELEQIRVQLNDKKCEIRRLENEVKSLQIFGSSFPELQTMPPSDGGLQAVIGDVRFALQEINDCSGCKSQLSMRLGEALQHLETVSAVMTGNPEDSVRFPLDFLRCESEENIKDQFFLSEPLSASDFDADCSMPSLDSTSSKSSAYSCPSSATTILKTPVDNERVAALENEMKLVNQECEELQEKLFKAETELKKKTSELAELSDVMDNLRKLNLQSAEQLQRLKMQGNEHLKQPYQAKCVSSNLAELEQKCAMKDFLLRSLADILRSRPELPCSTIVRILRDATYKPSYVKGLDFNLESLCRFIENGPASTLSVKKDKDINMIIKSLSQDEECKNVPKIANISPFHVLNRTIQGKDDELSLTQRKESIPTLDEPKNLRITRRVGADSLLLAWTPPEDTNVTGYTVYKDDTPMQKVRSSSRNKALLHGLPLDSCFSVHLESTGSSGQVSCKTSLNFKPEMLASISKPSPPPTPAQTRKTK